MAGWAWWGKGVGHSSGHMTQPITDPSSHQRGSLTPRINSPGFSDHFPHPSYRSAISCILFWNPKLWKPKDFTLCIVAKSDMTWANKRIYLNVLYFNIVNIHSFYHKKVNEFHYGVLLHTLMGVIYSPQYILYVSKIEKVLKLLWFQR